MHFVRDAPDVVECTPSVALGRAPVAAYTADMHVLELGVRPVPAGQQLVGPELEPGPEHQGFACRVHRARCQGQRAFQHGGYWAVAVVEHGRVLQASRHCSHPVSRVGRKPSRYGSYSRRVRFLNAVLGIVWFRCI